MRPRPDFSFKAKPTAKTFVRCPQGSSRPRKALRTTRLVILNQIIIVSYCIIFIQAIYSASKRITAGNLLNEFNSRLQVETKVNEGPLNAFTLVFFLFKHKHRVVEQLLQLLIRVVDAQLLKRVYLQMKVH